MAIIPVAGVTHQAVLKYGSPSSPSYVGLMLPGRDLANFTIEPYTPFAPKSAEGYAAIRDFSIASVWELFNDLSGGTGHLLEGKVEANTYAYARGNNITGGLGTCLYTAQKGKVLPAPASVNANTGATPIAAGNIKQWITFGGRIFALTDENPGRIFRWDAAGTAPTLVDTLNVGANTTGKQLFSDGTTLYCTRGPTQPIRQTTDGTTWTNNASTADFVEVRTGGVLCLLQNASFFPQGTEGYGSVVVGKSGTIATAIAVLEDSVLIGKPEGLYRWAQGRVEELFAVPWAEDTNNFSKMVVHNNLVYFNVRNKLYYTDLTNVVEIVPKDLGGFKAINSLASSHGPLMIGAKITPIPAFATSAGPRSVTTPATDITDDASYGTVAWTNPQNAGVSDAAYATAVLDLGIATHYLKALNFGFAIPSNAAITGIKVEIQKAATISVKVGDQVVKLVKGGVVSGDNKLAGGWPATETYTTYGGSNDLWMLSLTPADVNVANFGVVISGMGATVVTARVDHIRMTVYYTVAGGDLNYIFMFNGPNDPGLNPLWSDAAGANPIYAIGVSTAPDAAAARVYFDTDNANADIRYIDLDLNFLPKTYDTNASLVSYIYLTEFSAGFQSIKKWFYENVLNVVNPSNQTFAKVFYSIDGSEFVQAQDETGAAVEHTLSQRSVGDYYPLDTTGTYVQLKLALRTTASTGAAGISAVTIRGDVMVKPRYQIQFPADASQQVFPLQGPAEDGNAIKAAIKTVAEQGYPCKLQDYKGNWHLVLFKPPSPFEAIRDYAAPDAGSLLTAYPIVQMVLVEIDALASGGALNAWSPG